MKISIKSLATLPKVIASSAIWSVPDGADGQLKLVASLDMGGVTVQGLELIGRAKSGMSERNVSFSLVYRPDPSKRQAIQLGRYDWRPVSPHTNNHKSSPSDLFLVEIIGSHLHAFDLNWSEAAGRMLNNIPIARAVADPSDYRSLLDAVGKEFNIQGVGHLAKPYWQNDLFDGLNQ